MKCFRIGLVEGGSEAEARAEACGVPNPPTQGMEPGLKRDVSDIAMGRAEIQDTAAVCEYMVIVCVA